MKREECLDTAKQNVTGHRVQDYGKVENNFAAIAAYWNVYLREKLSNWYKLGEFELTPCDAANMMALFKWARITTGTATDDSYVDAAGYTACAAELADTTIKAPVGDPYVVKDVRVTPDGKGGFTYTEEGGM